MKTIKLATLFIISSILFISCSTKLSVTKRLYNKGYYIAQNKGVKTIKNQSNKQPITSNPVNVANAITLPNTASNVEKALETTPLTAQATVPSLNIPNQITGPQKVNKTQTFSHPNNLITPLKDLHKTYLTEKSNSGNSESRGLSLFWVIILIILILWFFGYIAGWGTGGLINLLLLIALILLILWLLRII